MTGDVTRNSTEPINPDDFVDYDDVDSDTVKLPDDSFSHGAVVDEEVGDDV